MFEQFSAGYYLGRLYVQPHGGSRALLRTAHHRTVRNQLYGTTAATAAGVPDGAETTAADAPLVMRYRQQHFLVDSGEDVPERTLVVPRDWLDRHHDSEEPREVFLAKADRAEQLLRVATPAKADGGADSRDERRGGGDSATDAAGGTDGEGSDDGGSQSERPFTPGALSDVARPGFRPQ